MATKQALGKGLGALISTRVANPTPIVEQGERVQSLDLDRIVASPFQPRSDFQDDKLQDLVESIRANGVLQPVIVRAAGQQFELIAGERRTRASRLAGLTTIPAIVRQATDGEVLEWALIENLQRENLNPIEEALAYAKLAAEFSLTQEDISKKVGKNRATVANSLRLLELAPDVQGYLKTGTLSVGHAKALLGLKSHEEQQLLASRVIREGASVRVTEALVTRHLAGSGSPRRKSTGQSTSSAELTPALQRVQNLLTHRFGTRVVIQHSEKKGLLQMEYYGSDDLNRLLDLLGASGDSEE